MTHTIGFCSSGRIQPWRAGAVERVHHLQLP